MRHLQEATLCGETDNANRPIRIVRIRPGGLQRKRPVPADTGKGLWLHSGRQPGIHAPTISIR